MNKEMFNQHYKDLKDSFDHFVDDEINRLDTKISPQVNTLIESMAYSLKNGGKRFRPILALMVGDLFSTPKEKILPYALSVELIHTYSLIHDDLPCMDDDNERRGLPTNHIRYGEDIALIAGDGLLTLAFEMISKSYQATPEVGLELTHLLSTTAGYQGMVGGQAIDLKAQKEGTTRESLQQLHLLKTGALIRSATEGAAIISRCSEEDKLRMREFGLLLGLAFQVADDILDHDETNPELGNFTTVIGFKETQELLNQLTEKVKSQLSSWGQEADHLRHLAQFNSNREV